MKETELRPKKVTLEDLLQLKRAERPPVEFWAEFDRTLRAKQLAAIVESRPWWRNWTARKTLIRVCVPLGATALVAMTFGSFRVALVKPVGRTASNVIAVQAPLVAMSAQENHVAPVVAETVETSSGSSTQANVSDSLPMVATSQTTGENSVVVESTEQMLASSTATVKAAGQVLAQLVGLGDTPSPQSITARSAMVEPLTQVATPRDNRRSRLLAYSVSFDPHAADSSDAVRSREKVTHRLSDEAIYDSITRLGLSGDRVSIKF